MSFEIAFIFADDSSSPSGTGTGRMRDKTWALNFKVNLCSLYRQIVGEDLIAHSFSSSEPVDMGLVKGSHALLTVLSEKYGEAPILNNYAKEFLEHVGEKNLYLWGRYRFLKIVRGPVSVGTWFPKYQYIPQYNFFDMDTLTQEHREFLHMPGGDTERSYWLCLADVVYDLVFIKKALLSPQKQQQPDFDNRRRTVYLAEVGSDMAPFRSVLKRELQQRDYRVLPENTTPLKREAIEKITIRDLERCMLSVHLMGEDYGKLLPRQSMSVIEVQNKVAHTHTLNTLRGENGKNEGGFYRLIWLNPNNVITSEKQKLFIERVKSEASMVEEAEVLEVDMPEFKSIVLSRLRSFEEEQVKKTSRNAQARKNASVYLMYDKCDRSEIDDLAGLLIDSGLQVLTLPDEGEPWELRETHQENLRNCDGSLIYLNKAKPHWLNTKLQDIVKAPAFGRDSAIKAKMAVLRSQSSVYQNLNNYIPVLRLKTKERPSEQSFSSFFKQTKQGHHG